MTHSGASPSEVPGPGWAPTGPIQAGAGLGDAAHCLVQLRGPPHPGTPTPGWPRHWEAAGGEGVGVGAPLPTGLVHRAGWVLWLGAKGTPGGGVTPMLRSDQGGHQTSPTMAPLDGETEAREQGRGAPSSAAAAPASRTHPAEPGPPGQLPHSRSWGVFGGCVTTPHLGSNTMLPTSIQFTLFSPHFSSLSSQGAKKRRRRRTKSAVA